MNANVMSIFYIFNLKNIINEQLVYTKLFNYKPENTSATNFDCRYSQQKINGQ